MSFDPPSSTRFFGSLPRPGSSKGSTGLGQSASSHDLGLDPPPVGRLGKFSNGSSSSLLAHGPHGSGSGPSLLSARKGSFASLKNVFKSQDKHSAIPPMPSALETRSYAQQGQPGYPVLRNPFSRFDTPPSPPSASSSLATRPRERTKLSQSHVSQHSAIAPSVHYNERKQSVTTLGSSHRSYGGRSNTSGGSSNFRAEDHPMPAMPTGPYRSAPSRAGRQGSDTSGLGSFGKKGSISGIHMVEAFESFGKTPAEEALKVVFHSFRELGEKKMKKVTSKPLVSSRMGVAVADVAELASVPCVNPRARRGSCIR